MATREGNILILDPERDQHIIRGLSSEIKLQILNRISSGPLNVNEISQALSVPQSTVATNILALEKTGLLRTENTKASKGSQKICHAVFDEIMISFNRTKERKLDIIEVEMPIGLYTHFQVSPPCGLCSPEKVLGFLDVPDSFFFPDRASASLLWFSKGFVEYKFPNNSLYSKKDIKAIELSMEISSEALEKTELWPSDITLWVNDFEIGTWTSPTDYNDRQGLLTPNWWKIEASQYGQLKTWRIDHNGSSIDGTELSKTTIDDIDIDNHHSIKIRIGIKDDAEHKGGLNMFGKNFGDHDQGIILKLLSN